MVYGCPPKELCPGLQCGAGYLALSKCEEPAAKGLGYQQAGVVVSAHTAAALRL